MSHWNCAMQIPLRFPTKAGIIWKYANSWWRGKQTRHCVNSKRKTEQANKSCKTHAHRHALQRKHYITVGIKAEYSSPLLPWTRCQLGVCADFMVFSPVNKQQSIWLQQFSKHKWLSLSEPRIIFLAYLKAGLTNKAGTFLFWKPKIEIKESEC